MSFARVPDSLLMRVSKPARYTGGEVNAVMKELPVPVRFAFCFPDAYEVGMSHLGLQIIYFLLNRRADTYCERAFMPWPDMLALMREYELPLFTLETNSPLRECDFIGFTLQYEMSFTNVLAMIELAGVPLRAADRTDGGPLICAGGPCACNPEPLAEFIDFFYIGDSEAALDGIIDCYRAMKEQNGNVSKTKFLENICGMPGVYVPAFYRAEYDYRGRLVSFGPDNPKAPGAIKKAAVTSLDGAFCPDRLIVPYIETVHDRAVIEVFRGCVRGCRFCQAGYIYRPKRERGVETLLAQAGALIKNTGHEEISLLALAACDYGDFMPLVDGLLGRFAGEGVNISLPSLRVDAMSLEALNKTQTVRKSSLTFAPEAGSQRLRDVINKNLTDADILDGCYRAFDAGFDKLKLYFMTGLPFERDEDLTGIASLCGRIVDQYYRLPLERRRRPVSVQASAACFVPKPFTAFQWAAQDSAGTFGQKQRLIKNAVTKKQIVYRYHDAATAVVEGALARGGRPLGAAIENAYRAGAVFDGWTEYFNYDIWRRAFADAGLDLETLNADVRSGDETFPWDFIDMGVPKGFLLKEWNRAKAAAGADGEPR